MRRARAATLAAALALAAAPRLLAQDAEALPPTGFGTLKVDDIALIFDTGDLRIRVLPLDERVLRLLATDSYASLNGLKRLKAAQIDTAARRYGVTDPALFLISVYGLSRQANFAPEDLTVQSRGRFFRAVAFAPLSSRWGSRQLDQRDEAIAVALFEPGIALFADDLIVSYGTASSDAWSRIARVLDRERNAVLSRAAAAGRH